MPAEISKVDGAVYAITGAWHGLGITLDHAPTAEEALQQANLGWTVSKEPIQLANGYVIPEKFATVRSDTGETLGIVGSDYTILQNSEAFEALSLVLQEEGILYESALSMRRGATVGLLARKPEDLKIGGVDVVTPYIYLTTSHDGTQAVRILPTAVRVVCWNTHSAALRNGQQGISVKHTSSMADRIKDARKSFQRANEALSRFEQIANRLADFRVSSDTLRSMIDVALDTIHGPLAAGSDEISNVVSMNLGGVSVNVGGNTIDPQKRLKDRRAESEAEILENLHNVRNTANGMSGTAWSVYNAISEWTDHQLSYRGAELVRAENRFKNILTGKANTVKQDVFELLAKQAI